CPRDGSSKRAHHMSWAFGNGQAAHGPRPVAAQARRKSPTRPPPPPHRWEGFRRNPPPAPSREREGVSEEGNGMNDARKSSVESSKAAEPVGPYPHARRVGDLLFLSGLGPRERGSKAIPGVTLNERGDVVDHDIVAQTHAVMRNIRAVLDDAGASWDDIVDVTVFLTDMQRDFATFNKVYGEYFQGANR